MAALEYGKYILVSRPHLDQHLGLWIPHVSVYWEDGDRIQFHRFASLTQTFFTEEHALHFGFAFARAWVDENSKNH